MRILYSILFSIAFLLSTQGLAQKFSLTPGAGFGKIIGETAEGAAIKGLVFLQGYYHIDAQLAVGFEVGTAGNFSPVEENEVSNATSITLSPFDTNHTILLLKGDYTFGQGELRPYVSLGLGTNTYFTNVHVGDVNKVKRTNFGVMPEVGLRIAQLGLSAKYILAGDSPEFSGTNEADQEVTLESERISILYFTLSYSFKF